MTIDEIIDELEIYTAGRLKKARVHITVEELQKFIDEIKALKQELSENAVNRATVLTLINDVKNADGFKDYSQYEYLFDQVDKMPPVTLTRKKGKCEFCELGKPLAIGKTNDQGIAIHYPNILNAYGYDIHGFSSNGINVKINYCPICGANMRGAEE